MTLYLRRVLGIALFALALAFGLTGHASLGAQLPAQEIACGPGTCTGGGGGG